MYWVKLVDCVIPCVVINPRRACAVRVAVRGLLVILSVWSVCPVKAVPQLYRQIIDAFA